MYFVLTDGLRTYGLGGQDRSRPVGIRARELWSRKFENLNWIMSFQYPSSNNGFLGIHGDRLPQGRLRWVESNDCSSSTESRRSSQFGGQLKIKQEEISNDEASAMFSQNSVVEQGARCAECPASPSPVCSPVTTSPALSPHQINGSRSVRCRGNRQYADSSTEGSIVLYNGNQSRGKEPLEASAGVAGSGPSSARSDNASFGVLPANLSSNRESKPISENPEEENDGVRDIHVTLERTRAAAASNETRRSAQRRQHNWSDTSMGSFVSSDTESISLSTEFNNVLAAAAAATSNSSAQALDSTSLINLLNENSSARSPAMRSTRLPGIGEEEPTRSTSEEAGDRNEGDANNGNGRRDNMALVPTSTTAVEGNREQRNAGRDYFALVPIDGAPESTGSTSDRDAPQSSWDAQHNEGAIVESGNANGDNTDNRGFGSSTSSIRSGNENRLPTPKQLALQKEVTLQKVKKDKIEAKAVAWEEAKLAKVDNRFKREETIIEAWENEQKVKANIKMKKVERKLEEKRATAFEKMQNEIAKSHRKAENRRAVAEARRGSAKAKIAEVADKIRSLGKLPRKFIFF